MSDDWNHWVLIKIIEHQKKLKILSINKIKKPKKDFNYRDFYKKENFFKRALKSFCFFKNKKIFSQNIKFTRNTPKDLFYFFKIS